MTGYVGLGQGMGICKNTAAAMALRATYSRIIKPITHIEYPGGRGSRTPSVLTATPRNLELGFDQSIS